MDHMDHSIPAPVSEKHSHGPAMDRMDRRQRSGSFLEVDRIRNADLQGIATLGKNTGTEKRTGRK